MKTLFEQNKIKKECRSTGFKVCIQADRAEIGIFKIILIKISHLLSHSMRHLTPYVHKQFLTIDMLNKSIHIQKHDYNSPKKNHDTRNIFLNQNSDIFVHVKIQKQVRNLSEIYTEF